MEHNYVHIMRGAQQKYLPSRDRDRKQLFVYHILYFLLFKILGNYTIFCFLYFKPSILQR